MAFKNVKIVKGAGGFGGPLVIQPTEKKNKVLCVTGQTLSPVAKKIAEMTGCELVDGFNTTIPDEEVAVAVAFTSPALPRTALPLPTRLLLPRLRSRLLRLPQVRLPRLSPRLRTRTSS